MARNLGLKIVIVLLLILVCITGVGWLLQYRSYQKLLNSGPTESYLDLGDEVIIGSSASGKKGNPSYIIIDKESMTLNLIDDNGRPMLRCGMACGINPGNKVEKGDNRTPEGIFHVQEIQDASTWKHDFGDGKGEIEGAYGGWFIRLLTPGHTGIGIHGTHDPASIGTRASEGCIRLNNEDLELLKPLVSKGMRVVIVPSDTDEKANEANKKTDTTTKDKK